MVIGDNIGDDRRERRTRAIQRGVGVTSVQHFNGDVVDSTAVMGNVGGHLGSRFWPN